MFKKSTQTCNTSDPLYSIPVVRTRNQEGPTTVYWRTNKASRFDLSSPLKFAPGETEKNIVIDPRSYPSPIIPRPSNWNCLTQATMQSLERGKPQWWTSSMVEVRKQVV